MPVVIVAGSMLLFNYTLAIRLTIRQYVSL